MVLELQQGILPKFLEGTLSQTKKGEKMIQKWQENVKEVKTLSALHTLFGILENSVKWDKSAEHVVSFQIYLHPSNLLCLNTERQ